MDALSTVDYHSLFETSIALPYALLALSILSLWIKRHFFIWGGLLLLAIIAAIIKGNIQAIALIPIIALGALYYLFFHFKKQHYRIWFGILAILLSTAFSLHYIPGFKNLEIVHQYKLTTDAIPFSLYLNFDKTLIGLFILGFGFSYVNTKPFTKRTISNTLIITILAVVVLSILAMLFGYTRVELKWDPLFYIWFLNNLIFVCIAEEAFFRGFLQKSFQIAFRNLRFGNIFALVLASLLFGIAHFQGGILYICLATIAGLFYGAAYLKTERIEASIFTHFMGNAIHLIFFTYPALQASS